MAAFVPGGVREEIASSWQLRVGIKRLQTANRPLQTEATSTPYTD
jgi:hypothetical protein